ncbi:hypothetical protein [Archangium gephyra]|uniref:hypothetical protein n=1 Tax=Archangium gephyra TaxID=48 RepID=UPI001FE1087F|nr:hypothetical protein [Archangium gephyra]
MNEVVGGVLARAVQQNSGTIRLHAFTFASNHFHLLVWARGAALASFKWFNWTKRWIKRGREDMAGAQGLFAQHWAELPIRRAGREAASTVSLISPLRA